VGFHQGAADVIGGDGKGLTSIVPIVERHVEDLQESPRTWERCTRRLMKIEPDADGPSHQSDFRWGGDTRGKERDAPISEMDRLDLQRGLVEGPVGLRQNTRKGGAGNMKVLRKRD